MTGVRRRTAAMRLAIFALVALPLSAPGNLTSAGGIDADELGYRLLTHLNATTTSDCIGLTHTPLCALETFEACGARNVDLYCDVGRGHRPPLADPDAYPPPPRPDPGRGECYRVSGSFLYRPQDVPDYNPWGIRAGDVAITTLGPGGYGGRCHTDINYDAATGWLLRRGPYGWYVVNHGWRYDYVILPVVVTPSATRPPKRLSPYRVLTQVDETSTSDCVGKVGTPLCAIETLMTCADRSVDLYCDIARGLEYPRLNPSDTPPSPNPDPDYARCYRVTGSLVYRPQDVPEPNPLGIQPGDVAVATVSSQSRVGRCDADVDRDDAEDWLLRRGRYGWYVAQHSTEIVYVHAPDEDPR